MTDSEALHEDTHERLVALLMENAAAGAQHVCDAVAAAVYSGERPKDDVAIVAVERLDMPGIDATRGETRPA